MQLPWVAVFTVVIFLGGRNVVDYWVQAAGLMLRVSVFIQLNDAGSVYWRCVLT